MLKGTGASPNESALHPKADIDRRLLSVRFVPIADIGARLILRHKSAVECRLALSEIGARL
jgi:hypothetical protein